VLIWLEFILCSAVIVFSGSRLSRYGDMLAEKTGLGRTWVGIVMLASVTSLPELMTGISSVAISDVPNIAVGDALGSCVFNLLILAMLDASVGNVPISSKTRQGNVLVAAFGIVLLSIAALGIHIMSGKQFQGWIGPYTLAIVVVYFLAIRMVFHFERRAIEQALQEPQLELQYGEVTTANAVFNYLVHAIVVVIAAMFLPVIGASLAEQTGLGQTFVGNALVAITTSLPELVVSAAAVKMGAVDLAMGNLFGSNIFNVLILAIDDMFYTKGPLLSYVEDTHIVSAFTAIAMSAVAIIGITYRAARKPLPLAWDSIAIVVLYILNLMFLFTMR
jgi:cation:H+ antiporter